MGLNNELKEIKELLQENNKKKEKVKKFNYPFGKKVGKAQRKKGYITVLELTEGHGAIWSKQKIENQSFIYKDIPRLATEENVFHDRKNPLIILHSWSVKPITPTKQFPEDKKLETYSPQVNFQNSLIDGTNIKGFKILLEKMKLRTEEGKKKIGGILPWILGLGVAGIIIYAIISGVK